MADTPENPEGDEATAAGYLRPEGPPTETESEAKLVDDPDAAAKPAEN